MVVSCSLITLGVRAFAQKFACRNLLQTLSTPSVNTMTSYHNLGDMRKSYKDNKEAFTEDQLVSKTDPFEQFANWFEQVKKTPEILEPNAMCLATSNKEGQPSARFVLLKGFGKDVGGFTFFTNYGSRKGKDLIRIEGTVSKVPESENDVYFKRRPLASQIGAAASEQSTVIANRDVLVEKAEEIAKNCNGTVERPATWGGYLLVPHFFEFWQGQTDRLHDRICFKRNGESEPWKLLRLAP